METPVILKKGMKPVKFVKGNYEVIFPTKALDRLYEAGCLANEVEAEIPINIYVEKRRGERIVTSVSFFDDPNKLIIVKTGLPFEKEANNSSWFAESIRKIQQLRSHSYNLATGEVDIDFAIENLKKLLKVMKEDDTWFNLFIGKKFVKMTRLKIERLLETRNKKLITILVKSLKDKESIYTTWWKGKKLKPIMTKGEGLTEVKWQEYKNHHFCKGKYSKILKIPYAVKKEFLEETEFLDDLLDKNKVINLTGKTFIRNTMIGSIIIDEYEEMLKKKMGRRLSKNFKHSDIEIGELLVYFKMYNKIFLPPPKVKSKISSFKRVVPLKKKFPKPDIKLHTHPLEYPSPPSKTDIPSIVGSKIPHGNLLDRNGEWELVLYYEPHYEYKRKQEYLTLFSTFWGYEWDAADNLRWKLAMQPQEV